MHDNYSKEIKSEKFLYKEELQSKIDNFLQKKKVKLKNILNIYGMNVELLHSSSELNKSLLKSIEILEKDIISIERIKCIQYRYSKKTPLYPLKGSELLSIIKNLKTLDISYRTLSQSNSPIPVDTNIWGENNTILVILLNNYTLNSSCEWDFANLSNESSKKISFEFSKEI